MDGFWAEMVHKSDQKERARRYRVRRQEPLFLAEEPVKYELKRGLRKSAGTSVGKRHGIGVGKRAKDGISVGERWNKRRETME